MTTDHGLPLPTPYKALSGNAQVDLNELDPKNIRFRSEDDGSTTTLHLNDMIAMAVVKLDIARLQRGWELIYKKYCKGKERPF